MNIKLHFLISSSSLCALPHGPIANHEAKISTLSSEVMEIVVQDRVMIEWNDFSIDTQETVRFSQPSVDSITLNRVIGSEMSKILGKLEANGKLLLINPNGVLFGKDASIDTGSLIASTLDIKNQSFLENNKLVFEGDSCKGILNQGSIHASDGDLFLIGHTVLNEGILNADKSAVGLFAAREVQIRPTGLDRIYTRGSSFSDVFVHPDSLNWDSVFQAINTGTMSGESAYVFGEQVLLRSGSTIDVSSDLAGGNVWIGGDYQGQNIQFENARYTWIEQGSTIDASAKREGNGGQIIIWAEKGTAFHGTAFSQGGPLGGDGGLVEVSGKEDLVFTGFVDRRAPLGQAGMLLLDPNDIDIVAPTTSANAPFPGPCGVGIWCVSGPLPNPATIAPADIITNLGGGPVTITTAGTSFDQGTAGNIRVISPISYFLPAPAALTLFANNDIFVNANIQNGMPGAAMASAPITLMACRNVTLDANVPAAQDVFVGSKNGPTTVTAGNDITINGSNGLSPTTQIGWRAANADVVTGAVVANAGNDILVRSGTISVGGAMIGHFCPNGNFTATAPVTATAGRDIILTTVNGVFKGSLIGHGYALSVGSTLSGTIQVTCGGNLSLVETTTPGGANGAHALIGFHVFSNFPGPHMYTGNVLVNVGGDFSIISTTNGIFKSMGIGTSRFGGGGVDDIIVTTNVRGAITMNGPSSQGRAFIGKLNFGGGTPTTGDVTVNCTGPLLMSARASSFCFIGHASNANNAGTVNVAVNAGPITITTVANSPRTFIGAVNNAGFATSTMLGNTNVTSTGTITINGAVQSGINAHDNVRVQALGDIIISGNSSIGTEHPERPVTTTILAGGSIIGTPNATFGIGYPPFAILPRINSLDMGAAGDIQMPNGFTTTTGFIRLAADTPIPPFNIPVPIFTTFFLDCNAANIFVTRPSFALSGPAIAANGSGAFRVTNSLAMITTTGDITIHSACQRINGNLQDLSIGPTPNDLDIITTSGDIEIGGSICSDGFNNLTINSVVSVPGWTQGNIYARACNDLTVNTPVIIAAGGALSAITLISDCDQSGSGNVVLDSDVTTIDGPLTIDAGILDASCNTPFCRGSLFTVASIIQTGGTISSAAGPITLLAQNNIQLNPITPIPAFCVRSFSGTINCFAGNDIIIGADQDIQTAAAINCIAGNNMTLSANATVRSTASSVTIAVDNNFPNCPFNWVRTIGTFTMDAGSSITGTPLLIFTALQGLNSINGSLNGASFTPSTLYTDTSSEVWCTFFTCPSNFSNCSDTTFPPGLGNPFTIFYKDCLQVVLNQANRVVSEFTFDANQLVYFLEWPTAFSRFCIVSDPNISQLDPEYYWIQRSQHRIIHLPYKKFFFGLSEEVAARIKVAANPEPLMDE